MSSSDTERKPLTGATPHEEMGGYVPNNAGDKGVQTPWWRRWRLCIAASVVFLLLLIATIIVVVLVEQHKNQDHTAIASNTTDVALSADVAMPSRSSSSSSSSSSTSSTNCVTPFGTLLGVSRGVPSYSNCNDDYTSTSDHYVKMPSKTASGGNTVITVYSGLEWQCVEYGRRFLMTNNIASVPKVSFGSVVGACDIWPLGEAYTPVAGPNGTVVNGQKYIFESHPNGNSTSRPQVGDLFIYPIQPGGFPYGHVTAVVAVNATHAMIAEENWDSDAWTSRTSSGVAFSRALELTRDEATGGYTVHNEPYIIDGWKRIGKKLLETDVSSFTNEQQKSHPRSMERKLMPIQRDAPSACDTPFGTQLGIAHGVPAYSNCNEDYTSDIANNVTIPVRKARYTATSGETWQCVEYARRFLMTNELPNVTHATFGDVEGAADMWPMTVAHAFTTALNGAVVKQPVPFESHPNGNSTSRPQVGDMFIYPLQPGGFPYGHVATMVGSNATHVMVAEQNWDALMWPDDVDSSIGSSFSRALKLTQDEATGEYTVHNEPYIIDGWKRVPVNA